MAALPEQVSVVGEDLVVGIGHREASRTDAARGWIIQSLPAISSG